MSENDPWEQQVSSWKEIASYDFEKKAIITDNEDLYLQIVSPKNYILTSDETLSVSKYTLSIFILDTLKDTTMSLKRVGSEFASHFYTP